MSKSSVYTKTGDQGQTGLVGGTRISKADSRIELYGEVDELNSFIGVVVTSLKEINGDANLRKDLMKIQSELFDLGSNLACEHDKRSTFKLPQITEESVLFLERKMDEMDRELPKLRSFILPGGVRVAAELHLCRTVCRRVERQMVRFADIHKDELPSHSSKYINRLSDYFFILSRYLNHKMSGEEILWEPSKN